MVEREPLVRKHRRVPPDRFGNARSELDTLGHHADGGHRRDRVEINVRVRLELSDRRDVGCPDRLGVPRHPVVGIPKGVVALLFVALDAGFDKAVQDLDDDATLLDHDRCDRAAARRWRNLLRGEGRHGVSPRR